MSGPVWLVSYPKSGNTWLRLLLANLLCRRSDPQDINDIGLATLSLVTRQVAEELTLVDTFLLTRDECDRIRPALMEEAWREAADLDVFIKLHEAYCHLANGSPVLGRPARAAVYILRDPRDVAVSLAFHTGLPIGRVVEQMLSGSTRMGGNKPHHEQLSQPLLDWSSHVRSWTAQRDVPVHVLRYEDLRADTAGFFGRAATFLGLEATPDELARAVRQSDFSELQRQETEKGFRERRLESTAPFFRAGRVGSWRDALTPDQASAIEAAHGAVMAEFGYL
ncbi:sulfotransferase domain-containing protein [Radicibacter daui]|uniref:sulfotransferase domain-containing protein n=1 Tax=Radicibacter daui TaxID=3064829 RepID=UPI004046994B